MRRLCTSHTLSQSLFHKVPLAGQEVHITVKIERINNKELLSFDSCSLTHIMSIQIYFTSFCCHSLCIDSRDKKTATEAASLKPIYTMLQECPVQTASDSWFFVCSQSCSSMYSVFLRN